MKKIDIENEEEKQEVPAEETTEQPAEKPQAKQEDNSPEAQLEKALAEVEEWKDKYLRQAAEFANIRRIIDAFERDRDNMDRMEDIAAVKEGVELIIEKFLTSLKREGLEKIDAVGKPFDVDFHEAIATVPGQPDEMRGKVLDCVQTGYTLNDKVIRHAKVAVAE